MIIEIKRDELPREALAQAIDYASNVAEWTVEKLSEICSAYTSKAFGDAFNEAFPEVELESVNLNSTQRIVLVGFSIESSLERMVEWLSDSYEVNVNVIVISYVKTGSGDELLMKTSIISEEMEQERSRKQKKFEIPMSDEPPAVDYDVSRLKQLLLDYLSRDRITNRRIREILLPALLKTKDPDKLRRDQLLNSFVGGNPNYDESKVGFYLTSISSQLGMKKNDFLRQIIAYDYPHRQWEKDNFSIRKPEGKALEVLGTDGYRNLVKEILEKIEGDVKE